jgi:pimeloyl-ACP methyl ester carboxylesterase
VKLIAPLFLNTVLLIFNATWLAAGMAHATEASQLPEPSGPYGIGRMAYDWIDNSRLDSLGPDPKRNREIMVYLWYPIERPAREPHGAYMPGATLIDADPELHRRMQQEFGTEVWAQILSGAIYSHVEENAPVAKKPERFPVVIFSHGAGGSSFKYASLFEAMVSRGYVVAAIMHPGIAGAVVFPNGRLAVAPPITLPPGPTMVQRLQRISNQFAATIEVGAADERFVLDRLNQENSDAKHFALGGRLDLRQVSVMGHSLGGDFAARACELDPGFHACLDLDGAIAPVAVLPVYPDGKTIQHPLLFLEVYRDEAQIAGTPEDKLAFFQKEKEQLTKCPPGSYHVVLNPPGIAHQSFTDTFILDPDNTPGQTAQAVHNLVLAESYVLAFLDKNLKHVTAPLLDSPSASHPEATIQEVGR